VLALNQRLRSFCCRFQGFSERAVLFVIGYQRPNSLGAVLEIRLLDPICILMDVGLVPKQSIETIHAHLKGVGDAAVVRQSHERARLLSIGLCTQPNLEPFRVPTHKFEAVLVANTLDICCDL